MFQVSAIIRVQGHLCQEIQSSEKYRIDAEYGKDNSKLPSKPAFLKLIWIFHLNQKLHWILYNLQVLFTPH